VLLRLINEGKKVDQIMSCRFPMIYCWSLSTNTDGKELIVIEF